MQNMKEDRWRPAPVSTPSSRLRAARSMPPWMQARGTAVPPPPLPSSAPPPPAMPPPPDPDYEVIEFAGQQAYSNTPPPRPAPPGKHRGDSHRCDLCGSSAPAVRCGQCSQQNFCLSCDEMYHRHPKRQTHTRKSLDVSRAPTLRPPLPPKGENNSAPVPPPRRHKRSGRNTPVPPDQAPTKPALGVMGSLKRMMGSRPLPPAPPMARDLRLPASNSPLNFTEFPDHQPPSRDSGYLDWEMDSRHRSGSLTALNSPSFGPIMHAQSMAQLNCPSCHHHGLVWDWNQGHMAQGGFGPAWGGMPTTGTWHGSAMLPPYQPEAEMVRRNSLRVPPRRSRRDLTTDDEEDHTLQRRRNTSPVRSRRGPMSDESEDEVMSHRSSRRHRRRNSPVSRNVSPTLSRRGSRKKSTVGVEELIARRVKQNEEEALRSSRRFDDETMSNRGGRRYDDETISNRGGRRYDDETMSNRSGRRFDDERLSVKGGRRQEMEETLSNRGNRRNDFDDSMSSRSQKFDDDVMSNRGGRRNDFDDTLSNRGQRVSGSRRRNRSPPNQTKMSPSMSRKYSRNESSEDSGDEMSDGVKNSVSVTKQTNRDINNEIPLESTEYKEEVMPGEVDKPLGPVPTEEWECDHCTFVNQAGTRVCMVCCKTTTNPKYKQQNKAQHKQQIREFRPQEDNKPTTRRIDSSTSPLKENLLIDKKEDNIKEDVHFKNSTKPQFTNHGNGDLSEKLKKELAVSPTLPEKKTETELEKQKPSKSTISTGTSPPPQSISTQTYDVLQKPKLKRATSLADHELWNNPQRNFSSRQSVTSDSQSLPVTPPRARTPEFEPGPREWELRHFDSRSQSQLGRRPSEPVHNFSRFSRRSSGSQPPEYLSTLVQKQVKQGMEMVKLLREAEEQQFSADDLSVALAQCGDGDPIAWLRDNWRNMIDTVVTLATNYGHERKENTVGTISVAEAREALRLHTGNVWAAVTECVEQRQKKYAELMSRGNFTREDIVTVLTANHGNLEAAYLELNKTQLKPFLMRIWGPPQGSDNDSANVLRQDENVFMEGQGQGREMDEEVSDPKFHRIKSWLDTYVHRSIDTHESILNSPNQSQLRKLSTDNVPVSMPKQSKSPLVDKSPPEIPPRRKISKVDSPAEVDYENILKSETNNNQSEYFSNSSPSELNMNSNSNRVGENIDLQKDSEVSGSSVNNESTSKSENKPEVEITVSIPLKRKNSKQLDVLEYRKETADEHENNENVLTERLNKTSLNSERNKRDKSPVKQIIIEKLIIDGKVQEVRRYVLDKEEAEHYIQKETEPLHSFYPKSVFSDVNSKLSPKENMSDTDSTKDIKEHSPIQNISNVNDIVNLTNTEDILRFEQRSKSTSYESLCYSENEEEDKEINSDIPTAEVVKSGKSRMLMDERVLRPTKAKSLSPSISDSNKDQLIDKTSNTSEATTESDNEDEEPNPDFVKTILKSPINSNNSFKKQNLSNKSNLPTEQGLTNTDHDFKSSNKDISTHKISSVPFELEGSSGQNTPNSEAAHKMLGVHKALDETRRIIGFERAGSISPSASEIIADSVKNSREVSPDMSEELIEEYEEEDVYSDENVLDESSSADLYNVINNEMIIEPDVVPSSTQPEDIPKTDMRVQKETITSPQHSSPAAISSSTVKDDILPKIIPNDVKNIPKIMVSKTKSIEEEKFNSKASSAQQENINHMTDLIQQGIGDSKPEPTLQNKLDGKAVITQQEKVDGIVESTQQKRLDGKEKSSQKEKVDDEVETTLQEKLSSKAIITQQANEVRTVDSTQQKRVDGKENSFQKEKVDGEVETTLQEKLASKAKLTQQEKVNVKSELTQQEGIDDNAKLHQKEKVDGKAEPTQQERVEGKQKSPQKEKVDSKAEPTFQEKIDKKIKSAQEIVEVKTELIQQEQANSKGKSTQKEKVNSKTKQNQGENVAQKAKLTQQDNVGGKTESTQQQKVDDSTKQIEEEKVVYKENSIQQQNVDEEPESAQKEMSDDMTEFTHKDKVHNKTEITKQENVNGVSPTTTKLDDTHSPVNDIVSATPDSLKTPLIIGKEPQLQNVTNSISPVNSSSSLLSSESSPVNNIDKDNSENHKKESPASPVALSDIVNKSLSNEPDEESSNSVRSKSNNLSAEISRTSERDVTNSQQSMTNSDVTHMSTPSSMPEYVLNEALNSVSSEDDRQSSTDPKSISTRGSSDKSQTSDRSLSMIESRAEILELLKASLSSDLVLDRIVSTLFASVLNSSDSVDMTRPGESDELLPSDSELKRLHTFSSSDSEVKTESDFYEAQEEVEDEDVEERVSAVLSGDEEEAAGNEELVKTELILDNDEQNENPTSEQQNVIEYERQVRRYLAEGLVSTYDQAELVVKLMELDFDKELSVSAATECSSLQTALTYLQQECHLCTGKYPMNQMISMLECEHRCCRDCALHYYTLQITERNITDCVCPFCKLPDLHASDPDRALDYFSNLDILLKGLLEETVHELFQRKLRDRTLMEDPNFKWCVKCSSGFIANPRQKRLVCPDCRSVTCANCRKPWEKDHEGLSCEAYAAWLAENNDSETQLNKHMADHGVTCPNCSNQYSLSKGGCMHLTCPQCQHEFCVGCSKPFSMGAKCKVSEFCAKLGLHAHHPRNCLFYLRDKEPQLLEKLLEDHNIEFEKEIAGKENTRCSVQLQRETPEGLLDSTCGLAVEKAGLCRTHFIEYLVKVIGRHKLDPVAIFDLTEVQQELRRRGKPLPIRAGGHTDADYTELCAQVVKEQIPLE